MSYLICSSYSLTRGHVQLKLMGLILDILTYVTLHIYFVVRCTQRPKVEMVFQCAMGTNQPCEPS